MKDLTLVILAAGMGSRFGGLKQIEPIGPNGEFIIDYSIYDAIKAGFNKAIFVIKEENYDVFKETIGKRIENHIKVEYVFQKTSDVPNGYLNNERTKPWGTAHALLTAKNNVNENFAMINADDFYGYDALLKAAEFLKNASDEIPCEFAMVSYKAKNTITKNGSVKRGICESENGYLSKITESVLESIDGKLVATPLANSNSFNISDDTLVSMNLFCFTPRLFEFLERDFELFLQENSKSLDNEFLIPDVVFKAIKENNATVEILKTDSKWYGVTYKEDKEEVVSAIKNMVERNIYSNNLWSK